MLFFFHALILLSVNIEINCSSLAKGNYVMKSAQKLRMPKIQLIDHVKLKKKEDQSVDV